MIVSASNHWAGEYQEEYYDDVSGQVLDTQLVRAAREEEMLEFEKHKVYTKVPRQQ